jgi:hypothetical protein
VQRLLNRKPGLPSDTSANRPVVVALVTRMPVVSVSQLWLIPIDSYQLHVA